MAGLSRRHAVEVRHPDDPGPAARLRSRVPGVRLRHHRLTTDHLAAVYPFQVAAGWGDEGVYIGNDRLAGGASFCLDPWRAYDLGMVTSPNIFVAGRIGRGKSAAVKAFLARSLGVFASPNGRPRRALIFDPKGEYARLAKALGMDVVKLVPGGSVRVNPLETGPLAGAVKAAVTAERTNVLAAMLSESLGRDLHPLELSVLTWSLGRLAASRARRSHTLDDLLKRIESPTDKTLGLLHQTRAEYDRAVTDMRLTLRLLLEGPLAGMFNGASTVQPWSSPRGMVIDLSAVLNDKRALALVMLLTTGWALAAFADLSQSYHSYLVLDEAWAVMESEYVARALQSAFKLSRAWGVCNMLIVHRVNDLAAQANDGTSTAKIAANLLQECEIRVLFGAAAEDVAAEARTLGLSEVEADILPRLTRGASLVKAGSRTALVDWVLSSAEVAITHTDDHMVA